MQALANVGLRLKTMEQEVTAGRQSIVVLLDSLKADHLRQVDAQNNALHKIMEVQAQHAARLDRILLSLEIEDTTGKSRQLEMRHTCT